jgi:hypothetical protein
MRLSDAEVLCTADAGTETKRARMKVIPDIFIMNAG